MPLVLLCLEWPLLPNKSIYTDWHKMFPHSGKGKQYPYLLDKILQNHREYGRARLNQKVKPPHWVSLLDYGCGKGGTAEWLQSLIRKQPLAIDRYDPGVPQYANTPLKKSYDLVYSCDVLEHLELEDVHLVIEHTQKLAEHNIHIIDMTPAKKLLPDGRNAHITLLDTHQWIEAFEQHTHTIEEARAYSVSDPRYGERRRVCIWTRKTKEYTKR